MKQPTSVRSAKKGDKPVAAESAKKGKAAASTTAAASEPASERPAVATDTPLASPAKVSSPDAAIATPIAPKPAASKPSAWSFGEWFDGLLQQHEPYIPFVLLLICAASRFYRLEQPNGVVFDETHFGRFTNQYHAHTYLFDM